MKPFANNPRTITKQKFKQLINKIKRNGYINRLIITKDNEVLGGNQRLQALQQLGYTEIDVLVPNVILTSAQADEINVTDNISAGDWDTDMLSSLFDAEQLIDWGMPPEIVGKAEKKKDIIDTENEEISNCFKVVVECEDETDQEAIYKLMCSKGYKCKILSI